MPYWNWTRSQGNDNDATLLWFSGDSDSESMWPVQCRRSFYELEGCNCTITRTPFESFEVIDLWGQPMASVNTFGLGSSPIISRAFGCLQRLGPSLPTMDIITYVQSIDRWYTPDEDVVSFSEAMAGRQYDDFPSTWPHVDTGDMMLRVYSWIAGSSKPFEIDERTSAASDPLFYMIASFTDLLFDQWLRRIESQYGSDALIDELPTRAGDIGHNADECLGGFIPLTTNTQLFTPSVNIGYSYDAFSDIDL